MKRIVILFAVMLVSSVAVVTSQTVSSTESVEAASHEAVAGAPASDGAAPWKYMAAAVAVGISCIAGGLAVGRIGAAAMGAMSENPELAGKALPYAGLAEGICLWGFLVALFILLI